MIGTATATEVVLESWARDRGIRPRVLLDAARRGRFPSVVRVSQRCHLLNVADLEAWRARSVVGPGGVAAALDSRPAEPFADRPDEEAGGVPATKPVRRRRAANAPPTASRRATRRKAAK